MRSLTTLPMLALLAAGCSSPTAPAAAPVTASMTYAAAAANPTPAPLPPPRLEYTGCRQLHAFIPFPQGGLAQLGFAIPPKAWQA